MPREQYIPCIRIDEAPISEVARIIRVQEDGEEVELYCSGRDQFPLDDDLISFADMDEVRKKGRSFSKQFGLPMVIRDIDVLSELGITAPLDKVLDEHVESIDLVRALRLARRHK
jgi:hypothetical protein